MTYVTRADHAEQLQAEFKQQPCHLERLYDIQRVIES